MARVKRGVIAGRRHKKVLAKAKGYYNARRKVYRTAKQAVIKAGQYAYRDRKAKKRDFRALWITRINAAARGFDLSYSRLMAGLKAAGLEVDRKMLADLAVHDIEAFGKIAEKAKASLADLIGVGTVPAGDCPLRRSAARRDRPARDCPRRGLSPVGDSPWWLTHD